VPGGMDDGRVHAPGRVMGPTRGRDDMYRWTETGAPSQGAAMCEPTCARS